MNRHLPAATALVAIALASCNSDSPGPDSDAVLVVSSEEHDFGSVAVGSQSTAALFTITNNGDGTTGTLSVVLDGVAADEFVVTDDACTGRVLQPDASCQLRVAMRPTFSGGKEASVRVAGRAGETALVAIRGASSGSLLSLTPSSGLVFNETRVAVQSATLGLLLRNLSSRPSGALTVELTGDHPADFAIALDACAGASLPAGAACGVSVRFRPVAAGERTATLRITSETGAVAATVRGVAGMVTALALSPATHSFGTVLAGAVNAAHTFQLTNSGPGPSGTLRVQLSGANPTQYRVETENCAGRSLAVGASCSIGVRFLATSPGPRPATLFVSSAFAEPAEAALSGEGAVLRVDVSPSSVSFPPVPVGMSGAVQAVSVTNTGTVPSPVLRADLVDLDWYDYYDGAALDFAITADTCTGGTLAPGASCSVSVRYSPTSLGTHSAGLSIRSDAAQVFIPTVGLQGQGTGLTPVATFLDFPPTAVGVTSAAFTLGFTNTASAASGSLTTSLTGAAFAIVADDCAGTVLPAGASCTVSMRFTPPFAGVHHGGLQVSATPGGTAFSAMRGQGM